MTRGPLVFGRVLDDNELITHAFFGPVSVDTVYNKTHNNNVPRARVKSYAPGLVPRPRAARER